jgi:hypothetical protein
MSEDEPKPLRSETASEREARLAKALRDNLRRRKAAAASPPPKPASGG